MYKTLTENYRSTFSKSKWPTKMKWIKFDRRKNDKKQLAFPQKKKKYEKSHILVTIPSTPLRSLSPEAIGTPIDAVKNERQLILSSR